jgi:hypothetical protein
MQTALPLAIAEIKIEVLHVSTVAIAKSQF